MNPNLETWLKELEALERAATNGLWEEIEPDADEGDIRVQVYHADKRTFTHDSDAVAWKLKDTDANFIAASRNALPKLLEIIRVQNEALKEARETIHGEFCSDEHHGVCERQKERELEVNRIVKGEK